MNKSLLLTLISASLATSCALGMDDDQKKEPVLGVCFKIIDTRDNAKGIFQSYSKSLTKSQLNNLEQVLSPLSGVDKYPFWTHEHQITIDLARVESIHVLQHAKLDDIHLVGLNHLPAELQESIRNQKPQIIEVLRRVNDAITRVSNEGEPRAEVNIQKLAPNPENILGLKPIPVENLKRLFEGLVPGQEFMGVAERSIAVHKANEALDTESETYKNTLNLVENVLRSISEPEERTFIINADKFVTPLNKTPFEYDNKLAALKFADLKDIVFTGLEALSDEDRTAILNQKAKIVESLRSVDAAITGTDDVDEPLITIDLSKIVSYPIQTSTKETLSKETQMQTPTIETPTKETPKIEKQSFIRRAAPVTAAFGIGAVMAWFAAKNLGASEQ